MSPPFARASSTTTPSQSRDPLGETSHAIRSWNHPPSSLAMPYICSSIVCISLSNTCSSSSSHSVLQPHEGNRQRIDRGHDAGADVERQDAGWPAHRDGRADAGGRRRRQLPRLPPPPPSLPPSPPCQLPPRSSPVMFTTKPPLEVELRRDRDEKARVVRELDLSFLICF
jgi:hypothetical protein